MLDSMLDYVRDVRDRPAWQAPTGAAKEALCEPLPREGAAFEDVCAAFERSILPYPTGNIHPRFFGWVHGSGTPVGMLAGLFAGAMNSNVGGRDHAAVYVERQVVQWFCEAFGYAPGGSGILLTGTSMANFAGVLVARTAAGGPDERLTAYASTATHSCVRKAFAMAGFARDALRILPVAGGGMDVAALRDAIRADRAAGRKPFLIVGTAGTVDTGSVDPLPHLADVAQQEGLWFHVDGAFGAMLVLSDALRPRIAGIERADSIAFDFHKWLHVQYDAACLLVRDEAAHRATFASDGPYITRMQHGLGAGAPWFADYGPDLSRGFRALKVWFTLKHFGTCRLAEAIEMNCAQAAALAQRIESEPEFELASYTGLNIVCFRHRSASADDLAIAVQESGRAVVSSTTVDGRRTVRACFTNHRTRDGDIDELIDALKQAARRLST